MRYHFARNDESWPCGSRPELACGKNCGDITDGIIARAEQDRAHAAIAWAVTVKHQDDHAVDAQRWAVGYRSGPGRRLFGVAFNAVNGGPICST